MILERSSRVGLHWRLDGEGEPAWLMFNGASLPLAFWDPVALPLAAEHRVLRLDQRNAGDTRAEGSFSLNDVAADAAALLDHLGIAQVIVAGHAWGGRVAQVFARDHPHRVKGMVICGTGGQLPASTPPQALAQMREALRAGNRDAWAQANAQAWCAPEFGTRNPLAMQGIVDLLWPRLLASRGQARAVWDAKVSPSASYWGSARVPTCLIYGSQDTQGTPDNARDLAARIPDAELHFVPQAGHFVVREQPGAVLDRMRAFAQRLAST